MKRFVRLASLVVGTVLLLSSLSVWAAGQPPASNGTLTIAIVHDVITFDPANYRDRVTEAVIRQIYDGLVTRGPDMKVVPQLATSWDQVSPTKWVFHLRHDVTWQDGTPFTADDVVFSINRIVKPGQINGVTSPRKSLLGSVTGAVALDKYTVQINLATPWPPLISFLPFQEMVCKQYVEKHGDAYLAQHPMGTGPFKLVEWDKGSQIVMQRYDKYYGGPAKFAQLIFKVMPETATRIAALRAGQVDIITDVPPDLVSGIQADSSCHIATCRGTRSYFLELNITKPPFNDVRVRQAMNYGIDFKTLIDTMLGGFAERIPTLLSPDAFGYNAQLKPYPYDPAKAKELLKEAGYPNGFKVTLDCESYAKDVSQAYAQMLRNIGIDASVQVWDWGVLKPQLVAHKRQIYVGDWGNASLDPAGILIPKLETGGRGNYSGYSNPAVDTLFELTESTTSTHDRALAFEAVQDIIYKDAPMVFGYVAEEIYGVSNRVKNWKPSPDGKFYLLGVTLGS